MPKGTPAPYYTSQIKPLIGKRGDPDAIVTSTSNRIFLEIRQKINLDVPDIAKGPDDTFIVKFVPWEAKAGQVLMSYLDIVSPETRAVIGPIVDFRGTRLKRVMLIEDILAAARMQFHILESYIGKQEKVYGTSISLPGEIDRLKLAIGHLSDLDPASEGFSSLLSATEGDFRLARNKWKKSINSALKAGNIDAAKRHALHRIDEIYDIVGGILNREEEARRIINKIRRGFAVAYLRMHRAIEQIKPEITVTGRRNLAIWIDEKIIEYLIDQVAAFEPFYSGARTAEVQQLKNVGNHLISGRTATSINLLRGAMNSIGKFVLGEIPSAKSIRDLYDRLEKERRRP